MRAIAAFLVMVALLTAVLFGSRFNVLSPNVCAIATLVIMGLGVFAIKYFIEQKEA